MQNPVASLISDARDLPLIRKICPPHLIRTAARRFKRKTSIVSDNWTFDQIIMMPDCVLISFGILLADIQCEAIPPLQVLLNLVSSIPKKDGGTRTIAIAATLYRLIMQLDTKKSRLLKKTILLKMTQQRRVHQLSMQQRTEPG